MFRCILPVIRTVKFAGYSNASRILANSPKAFSSLNVPRHNYMVHPLNKNNLVENKQILDIASKIAPISIRTVTKFSLKKGKRKTVKAVIRRFLRLHWGGWIRTKCGRTKKLWKKSSSLKRRKRQHVFVNATQATLLDKMVTKFWKKPKYYVNDPYTPYHTREEFMTTRKQPLIRD